jgi:hypothetical protein
MSALPPADGKAGAARSGGLPLRRLWLGLDKGELAKLAAVTAMASAKAHRGPDDFEDPPGVLRSLLMALGLPLDAAHSANRPALLVWGLIVTLVVVFGAQLGRSDHLRHWVLVPAEVLTLQVLGILGGERGIAFWAHIGGFVAGVVWGWWARPASAI